MYFKNHLSSIPNLIECLHKFGKKNEAKSEAMMITGRWPKVLDELTKFKWPKEGFKYLGIWLTKSSSQLYKADYKTLLTQITKDLERWQMLPLTLIGRVETIKMNLSPKLLFLFNSLPINDPNTTFRVLNKLISRFIWQKKRPRIRIKLLCLPKEGGGLALPHFKNYF